MSIATQMNENFKREEFFLLKKFVNFKLNSLFSIIFNEIKFFIRLERLM